MTPIELRQALFSYQDYRMLLLSLCRYADLWAQYDPGCDGFIKIEQAAAMCKLLPSSLGYNPAMGEDRLSLAELRLPEMPSGSFCRFLVYTDQENVSVEVRGEEDPSSVTASGRYGWLYMEHKAGSFTKVWCVLSNDLELQCYFKPGCASIAVAFGF